MGLTFEYDNQWDGDFRPSECANRRLIAVADSIIDREDFKVFMLRALAVLTFPPLSGHKNLNWM